MDWKILSNHSSANCLQGHFKASAEEGRVPKDWKMLQDTSQKASRSGRRGQEPRNEFGHMPPASWHKAEVKPITLARHFSAWLLQHAAGSRVIGTLLAVSFLGTTCQCNYYYYYYSLGVWWRVCELFVSISAISEAISCACLRLKSPKHCVWWGAIPLKEYLFVYIYHGLPIAKSEADHSVTWQANYGGY